MAVKAFTIARPWSRPSRETILIAGRSTRTTSSARATSSRLRRFSDQTLGKSTTRLFARHYISAFEGAGSEDYLEAGSSANGSRSWVWPATRYSLRPKWLPSTASRRGARCPCAEARCAGHASGRTGSVPARPARPAAAGITRCCRCWAHSMVIERDQDMRANAPRDPVENRTRSPSRAIMHGKPISRYKEILTK